jgi:hypothetical protein
MLRRQKRVAVPPFFCLEFNDRAFNACINLKVQ